MTATVSPFYTIFESEDQTQRDLAFEVDELVDIANHGCAAGVSGLIYTRDCVEWFDENEDTIEEYLSDWYFDNLNERNYLAAICNDQEPCSIDELKTKMVWMYVELRAHDILCEIKHPDFY